MKQVYMVKSVVWGTEMRTADYENDKLLPQMPAVSLMVACLTVVNWQAATNNICISIRELQLG